ncbi:MAG: methyltransferase, partial [Myxococcales bacterium]|nr:methyltransferase [Myxococcales bacterium]
ARVYDLRWQGELAPASYARLDAAVRAGELAGARVWLGGAREPLSFGDARPRMPGPDGRELVLAAGAFAQPSDAGALALADTVRGLASRVAPGRPALELFAGSGTLTVALAPETGALEAVESEPASLACLRDNLRARGLAVRARQADANAFAVPRAVELVVLDPPRAGAPGAVEHVAASRARHVVYVSCAPMTLARDAARLAAAGFVLRELVSVELFPQTEHAEAIAWLAR